MKLLLSSQRKLGNRWKEEMSTLTQVFETTIRDLSAENKQMKRLAEKLKADLKEKSAEAKEAKEMNGIYSAKLTKMERKFKKLRDQDEESYIDDKNYLISLWKEFIDICDDVNHFLSELSYQFHPRCWEMYLGVCLKKTSRINV